MSDGKYEDYDWEELPTDIQEAYKALGYNKKMWDKHKSPPAEDKDWEDLTEAEKAAATKLGYNQEKWDKD